MKFRLRDLKISTQKKKRKLKLDKEDGRFNESVTYNFDNENDTPMRESAKMKMRICQRQDPIIQAKMKIYLRRSRTHYHP